MEKTHIEIETNIMGKKCVLYNYATIQYSATATPPAVCLVEGLAVPRKIKFVCGVHVEKRKNRPVWTV